MLQGSNSRYITIRNSIFWGNVAVTGSQLDSLAVVDISDSVVQDGWAGGSNIITADPMLGTFGDYGGGTSTIPILPGSSAQDVVDAAQCPATDQRGMIRPQGLVCDLGAFEAGIFLTVATDGNGSVTSQPAGINCPTERCLIDYAPDTTVTLTAASQTNPFAGWSGACTGVGQCIVALTAGQSVTATFAPKIVRVTPNGTAGGSCGETWMNPCRLQYALATIAAPGDEVWVAQGTYAPTTGTDRTVSFQLRDDIALYGGFAMTETAREQRNWKVNATTLSGDIGAAGNSADDSYHVVNGSGTTGRTILDGFAITGGNATGSWPNDSGGGMYNLRGSPALTHVLFLTNTATTGGGMYNGDHSQPTLTDVTFRANSSASGGGMYNDTSDPILTNVTFAHNTSTTGGGGMRNRNSQPVLTNVTFYANTAANGGGIRNYASAPLLKDVTFYGNVATQQGGAMYSSDFSTPTLRSNIVWGNTAIAGTQLQNVSSKLTISDSVMQGGYAGGINIITADPMLEKYGDYDGATSTVPILPDSSAQDAGSVLDCPATDQRGVSRPQGAACDLGAFEARTFVLVTLAGNGYGMVTSKPAGIDCPMGVCALDYAAGTSLTLTATANPGSTFMEWGGACAGSGLCVVTVDVTRQVMATFTTQPVYLPLVRR